MGNLPGMAQKDRCLALWKPLRQIGADGLRACTGLEGVLQLAESIPLQDTLLAADLDVSRDTDGLPSAVLATSAAIDALPL